jgi:hypothetical protein
MPWQKKEKRCYGSSIELNNGALFVSKRPQLSSVTKKNKYKYKRIGEIPSIAILILMSATETEASAQSEPPASSVAAPPSESTLSVSLASASPSESATVNAPRTEYLSPEILLLNGLAPYMKYVEVEEMLRSHSIPSLCVEKQNGGISAFIDFEASPAYAFACLLVYSLFNLMFFSISSFIYCTLRGHY